MAWTNREFFFLVVARCRISECALEKDLMLFDAVTSWDGLRFLFAVFSIVEDGRERRGMHLFIQVITLINLSIHLGNL